MTNTKAKGDREQRVQIKTRTPGPVKPSGFTQLRPHADLDSVDTVAEILSLPVEGQHPAATAGSIPAPGEQSTRGISITPGSASAPGDASTPGSSITPGDISTPGKIPAPGRIPTPRKRAAPGGKHASGGPLTGSGENVSPRRDFTKTPNSVVRDVLSRGLFRGKSRDVYDYLYSRTRGAITPRRSALLTAAEIMRGANVGSDHTLRDNIRHLILVGLIERQVNSGTQAGNEYFVFLPEEVNLPFDREGHPLQLVNPPQSVNPGHRGQELPGAPGAGTAGGAGGALAEGSTASGEPKTSFKTKEENPDDEALALFAAALGRATHDLTGRGLSPSEAQRWAELADVLVTELKIAAGRTTVSSVPAFLAEHLRRRLWKQEKRQLEIEPAAPPVEALPPLSKEQIADCPDCFGTGMYYPQGYEKGVAKCPHAGLARQTVEAPAAKQPPPPTDEEAVRAFVDLLHSGTSLDDLDDNFSASVGPERWPGIRAAVLERYEAERGRVGQPGDVPGTD